FQKVPYVPAMFDDNPALLPRRQNGCRYRCGEEQKIHLHRTRRCSFVACSTAIAELPPPAIDYFLLWMEAARPKLWHWWKQAKLESRKRRSALPACAVAENWKK